MPKRVNGPFWIVALLAVVLPSCGTGGKVDAVSSLGDGGPLRVTTQSLPRGIVGRPYQAQLTAQGGAKPYTWSIPFSELPPGLSLNPSTGLVKGTPTEASDYSFTVRVADSTLAQQQSAMAQLETAIEDPQLTIITEGVPKGFLGLPYSWPFYATGGTPPYSWSIVDGSLPPDLRLDPASGLLSGIPTVVGDYSFTVQVTDSGVPASVARLSVRSHPLH